MNMTNIARMFLMLLCLYLGHRDKYVSSYYQGGNGPSHLAFHACLHDKCVIQCGKPDLELSAK